MFYKECFIIFASSLRKPLTTSKLERTKAQPEELPFLPASLCPSTKNNIRYLLSS